MDEVGLKNQPEVFGEVSSWLCLPEACFTTVTWRTYPSSLWTKWVLRLNPRFLARSITDYAVPEAGFSTVYLKDVSILRMDGVSRLNPRILGRSIPNYTVPEAGFCTVYLEDVSILSMDEVGLKTQSKVTGEVYYRLYCMWGLFQHCIPGGHIHPLYGRGGFQDSPQGYRRGPFLTMLTWGWLHYCIPAGRIHLLYGQGGSKTQPALFGEVHSWLSCTWGLLQHCIPGGRIHPPYGWGGFQDSTRDFGEVLPKYALPEAGFSTVYLEDVWTRWA